MTFVFRIFYNMLVRARREPSDSTLATGHWSLAANH